MIISEKTNSDDVEQISNKQLSTNFIQTRSFENGVFNGQNAYHFDKNSPIKG